ncbi:LacI family DNA-binding transcriptional regulator [Bifidobacterium sp. MA2]|uniref:LacI family DNA-binding transcriptional regulator n=1 Tax=Bifidobacterium santillanense TaxID=2809028 RepID=A0ABS5UP43_9BIFI|nr:LacI family DNA-binding transcriptional regulator [Bifidobacterium santillanense]MBT1172637.1 LacI family DNA-binding transcriptional regulator [Bifidobacterium santillanense]
MAMGARRITMKDVALEAGVSMKTVSNVVNGNDSQMSAATKAHVTKAIAKLGYSVNHAAQALKKGRSGVIGLAVPNFDQAFFGYFVDTLSKAARERGYAIIISTFGEFEGRIDGFAPAARKLNADGWIMFADMPVRADSPVFTQDYPLVLTGDYSSHGLCDMVTMPNAEAARHVTGWLLDRGATDVGFIGAPMPEAEIPQDPDRLEQAAMSATEGNAALRLQGYIQAFRSRGLAPDWRHIIPVERLTGAEGVRAAFELVHRASDDVAGTALPDALVCANDALAIGVLSALTKSHIDVPGDIQVTGIDALPDGEYAIPPLTTIDPRVDQYVDMAVDALIRRIDGDESAPSVYTSGFRLIERDSTR